MNSVHVKIIQILPSSPNFLCIHGSKSIHSSLYFSTVIIPVDLLLDNPHVCWKSKYWMRSVPCKFVNIAVKLLTVDSIVVSGCVCRHALMCFGKGSNLYFLKIMQLHTYTYMRWLCHAWTALLCVVVLHWTCHTFFFFWGGGLNLVFWSLVDWPELVLCLEGGLWYMALWVCTEKAIFRF